MPRSPSFRQIPGSQSFEQIPGRLAQIAVDRGDVWGFNYEFTKTNVRSASALGTVFPLVFDEVDLVRKTGAFEEVLKSHWQSWWREDAVTPQLIFTSNTDSLKDWAKSRVKRVDFDVCF